MTDEATVKDPVAVNPAAAAVFDELGIEFCREGDEPISIACAQRGAERRRGDGTHRGFGRAQAGGGAGAGADWRESHGFQPPAYSGVLVEQVYEMPRAFEHDLHWHVHLENNVLFPRAFGFIGAGNREKIQ